MKMKWSVYQQVGRENIHTLPVCFVSRRDIKAASGLSPDVLKDASFLSSRERADVANLDFISGPDSLTQTVRVW